MSLPKVKEPASRRDQTEIWLLTTLKHSSVIERCRLVAQGHAIQTCFYCDFCCCFSQPAQFHKFKATHNNNSELSYENPISGNSGHLVSTAPAGWSSLVAPVDKLCLVFASQAHEAQDGGPGSHLDPHLPLQSATGGPIL